MSEQIRITYIRRLREDLIGPAGGDKEIIDERPSDRYLTGILYAQNEQMTAEDDEKLETEISKGGQEGETSTEIAISRSMRPATAGISFSLKSEDCHASLVAHITCAIYRPFWLDKADGSRHTERPANKKADMKWERIPLSASIELNVAPGTNEIDLSGYGLNRVFLFVKASQYADNLTTTLQVYNGNIFESGIPFHEKEQSTLFQFKMKVEPTNKTKLMPRPVVGYSSDEDTEISALIYRNTREYASGHTCAAIWEEDDKGNVHSVETEWIPQQKVYSVDASGDEIFNSTYKAEGVKFPTAHFLSKEDKSLCIKSLKILVSAYDSWLKKEAESIASLPITLRERAQKNIDSAKHDAVGRMLGGIELLQKSENAWQAFRLANQSMQIQAAWKKKFSDGIPGNDESVLKWRPFQLGFCLMALNSLADKKSPDRNIMDLIWFPTGGGKTEAYLLLTAFILFYRRINTKNKISAYGIAVFMRYTLRTLTVQQFDRAAALITACETIRRSSEEMLSLLGDQRFSIGLWVGETSTPNNYLDARASLATNDENTTPAQVKRCPSCDKKLDWKCDNDQRRVLALCNNDKCNIKEVPVITIDDQIYSELPSLVIGTVDKFAQIVRKKEAVKLFGVDTPHDPPDLIIQDELHLISGPLGTIVGLYEAAIDRLCSENGCKPKIIGSTATIRRAKEQVHGLFDRDAYQFPPPIINADNSCFSKTDYASPGRIYVGITTAGRSEKFALQAVSASLLQSLEDSGINQADADNYSTFVAYFNSLRVLGGALVVMQDDVENTLNAYATRRGEKKRTINAPEEMTSRKKSKEIPEILERLSLHRGEDGFIDILLATNMLSVGVDIPRLGLMLVAGQTKTMSEYIQATSRVGRQKVPGLIITNYNNNKIRDRAHYESFKTWHQSLYRELEGSSVTPFAARARDKALHAPLVVLARHLIAGLKDSPVLTPDLREEIEKTITPYIMERVSKIDRRELADTEWQLQQILDEWENRDGLQYYWAKKKGSLLVSADDVAQVYAAYNKKAEGISTPNTMRNVEAQTSYFLKEHSNFKERPGTEE